jgi:hypothetical protein
MVRREDSPKRTVGIVTFHNGFNCGAFLQAFALQKTVKWLGYKVEIIDYKAKHHSLFEYKFLFFTKRIRVLLGNFKKYFLFKRAHKLFNLSTSATEASELTRFEYDAVIYGSDEIWNYSNSIVGIDPVYFGLGVNGAKKISYAPSCGSLSDDVDFPSELRDGWQGFSDLSVRDLNSKNILQKYIKKPIHLVLDPTFLYDFSGMESKCPEKDFILIYTTGFGLELQSRAKAYASKKGKRLISIGYVDNFSDHNAIGIGPFEFLGYFKSASEVITNTLHGTIFAVKYNKPLAIICDSYRKNKLATIISKFDLECQMVPEDGAGLEECLERNMDYHKINKTIHSEVLSSRAYLAGALSEI